MTDKNYLKIAVAAAKQCGPSFIKYFGHAQHIQMKNNNPRNLVTEIDKSIEQQIRTIIVKRFPSHKIIGEEYSKDIIEKHDLVWIIDPVDGTTNYIQGLPFCCISIALWDGTGPRVAVLYNPVLNQLFTAIRSRGAKLNNRTIKVSNEKSLGHAFGGIGWLRVEKGIKLFATIAKSCRKIRVLATSAMQIGLVASGNLDFYVTSDIKIWDFAAAVLIATEAGATVTDWKNNKVNLETKNLVASNRPIHNSLINQLKILK